MHPFFHTVNILQERFEKDAKELKVVELCFKIPRFQIHPSN